MNGWRLLLPLLLLLRLLVDVLGIVCLTQKLTLVVCNGSLACDAGALMVVVAIAVALALAVAVTVAAAVVVVAVAVAAVVAVVVVVVLAMEHCSKISTARRNSKMSSILSVPSNQASSCFFCCCCCCFCYCCYCCCCYCCCRCRCCCCRCCCRCAVVVAVVAAVNSKRFPLLRQLADQSVFTSSPASCLHSEQYCFLQKAIIPRTLKEQSAIRVATAV